MHRHYQIIGRWNVKFNNRECWEWITIGRNFDAPSKKWWKCIKTERRKNFCIFIQKVFSLTLLFSTTLFYKNNFSPFIRFLRQKKKKIESSNNKKKRMRKKKSDIYSIYWFERIKWREYEHQLFIGQN